MKIKELSKDINGNYLECGDLVNARWYNDSEEFKARYCYTNNNVHIVKTDYGGYESVEIVSKVEKHE